ncbi:MAG: hypothetical protein V4725_18400 [Bacteroidota bacterium]
MNRVSLLLAATVYIILFFLLFPWYQFVLDIDAISYIHVAERYASGDFFGAVNGYWSPLISWILIPFIKSGQDPVIAAKYINGLIGLLALFTCQSLLNKFVIHSTLKNILPFIFAGLLLSYAFYELCADLLQLWLLLLYLNLLFSKNFIENNYKIVGAAILAAACYYAKAYSFPFFLVHFPLILYVLLKRNKTGHVRRLFLAKVSIAFLSFFVLTAPYLLVLKEKYGSFRINNAGKLNTSWFLSPGISDNRKMVAEPPFVDATSYWDEPTYAQEKYVGPFTSGKFFLVQVKWTISNIIKFFGLLNLISICAVTILLCFIVLLYRRKKDHEDNDWLLLLTTLLYPSGYILIFIEWRYIWLLPIMLLIMAAISLTWLLQHNYIRQKFFALVCVGFSATFLVQPVNELQDLRNNNKDVYAMAEIFRQQKISGNFFLNYKSFLPYGKTVVLSYLTKSKLFGPVLLDYSFDELILAAKKHNIDYYLYFYDFPNEKEIFLQSPYAKVGTRVYDNLYPGVIVVQFK